MTESSDERDLQHPPSAGPIVYRYGRISLHRAQRVLPGEAVWTNLRLYDIRIVDEQGNTHSGPSVYAWQSDLPSVINRLRKFVEGQVRSIAVAERMIEEEPERAFIFRSYIASQERRNQAILAAIADVEDSEP